MKHNLLLSYKFIDSFAYWVFHHVFVVFLKISFFPKKYFRNITRVSNSLDPDHARCFVSPDLGPNCLQRLSADDSSRLRVYEDNSSK